MEKPKKFDSKLSKIDKVIKRTINIKWIIQVSILAFVISLIFSGGSGIILESVNVYSGILIVLFFILVGVIFDMIGIAVASAEQKPFHSMAAKQVHGSKTAIMMIKHAEKVSAFCNDVIGDICNIISGSAGAVIAVAIADKTDTDPILVALLVTATIASVTIGGKAMGKSFAINKSEVIVYRAAKVLKIFTFRDK